MQKLLLAAVAALLAGCASHQETLQQAGGGDRKLVLFQGGKFAIQATLPGQKADVGPVLRVYIEGDGRAWVNSRTPSLDPTPRSMMLAEIAANDPRPAVYLARPCQYVLSPACDIPDWTTDRFSQAAVSSMSGALDQLRTKYSNTSFELVGYSGGGAMALLLAAQRNDISAVQTLAGNLAPSYWARSLGLSPLTGSLEPLAYVEKLNRLPQRHFVGDADKVVPGDVARHYQAGLGASSCSELVFVPATHYEGLQGAWARHGNESLPCTGQKSSLEAYK